MQKSPVINDVALFLFSLATHLKLPERCATDQPIINLYYMHY